MGFALAAADHVGVAGAQRMAHPIQKIPELTGPQPIGVIATRYPDISEGTYEPEPFCYVNQLYFLSSDVTSTLTPVLAQQHFAMQNLRLANQFGYDKLTEDGFFMCEKLNYGQCKEATGCMLHGDVCFSAVDMYTLSEFSKKLACPHDVTKGYPLQFTYNMETPPELLHLNEQFKGDGLEGGIVPWTRMAYCLSYQLEHDECPMGCTIDETGTSSEPEPEFYMAYFGGRPLCFPGISGGETEPSTSYSWRMFIGENAGPGDVTKLRDIFGHCDTAVDMASLVSWFTRFKEDATPEYADMDSSFYDLHYNTLGFGLNLLVENADDARYVNVMETVGAKIVAAEQSNVDAPNNAATCGALGTFTLDWSELALVERQLHEFEKNTNYAGYVTVNDVGDFEVNEGEVGGLDTVWLLLTSIGIFTFQAAHIAIVNGKQGRYGNYAIKATLNFCVAGVAWYITGYAFTYGRSADKEQRNAFIGNYGFVLYDYDAPEHSGPFYGLPFWIHGFAYALVANLIVSSAIGGKGTVLAHILSSWFVVGFAYPVVAHWVLSDNGWLSAIRLGDKKEDKLVGSVGCIDFAASGPVHLFAASAAFAASLFARKAEVPKTEDVDQLSLGTSLTLFAAFSYIVSSAINPDFESMVTGEHHYAMAAGRAAINFTMSVAGSVFLALFLEAIVAKEFNLTHTVNAINAGFAAICSNCLTCEPWAAFGAGLVAGLLYFIGRRGLAFLKDNDTFATHGLGGAWGLIFTGVMAKPQLIRTLLIDSWYGGVGAKPTGFNATTGLVTFEGSDEPFNPYYSVLHAGVFYPKKNVHGKLLAMMILEAAVLFAWGFCITLPLYALLWAVGQLTIKEAAIAKADA